MPNCANRKIVGGGFMAIITLATARPAHLAGQASSQLLQKLAREVPAEKRNAPPPDSLALNGVTYRLQACPPMEQPDSIALAAGWGVREPALLQTWQRSSRNSKQIDWSLFVPVNMGSPDTLRARLVRVDCGYVNAGVERLYPTLLLERDGLYFSMPATNLTQSHGTIALPDTSYSPAVFVIRPNSTLDRAVFNEIRGSTFNAALDSIRGIVTDRPPAGIFGYTAFLGMMEQSRIKTDSAKSLHAARLQAERDKLEGERVAEIQAKRWARVRKNEVINRHVRIGMTAEMVELSWGSANAVNKTVTAQGASEQWVYENSYVYLVNGVVTAIQTNRKAGD